MKTFREIAIVGDAKNEEAMKYHAALELELKKREALIAPCSDPMAIEKVIVLGGDGTMLKTAHEYDFSPLFLGINLGHKGFLMNDRDDPSDVADKILDEKFKVHQFPLLEIESAFKWKDPDVINSKYFAMDDIYFNRISGKTCKVKVEVNGVEVSSRIAGDGIVICTALGSTGYFVPVGGSAIHPKLAAIGFSPVSRNIPIQIVPMVFPLSSKIEVTLLSPPEEIRGFYDGMEMPYFQKIKVRKGNKTVKLAFFEGENFTERLITKIMKAQEVNNG